MVYKIKPLELSLDFEDRIYELGDTINVEVELAPSSDVGVREARVDLICEERFVHSFVHKGPGRIQGMGMARMPQVTLQKTQERIERYVHSSAVFLNETRLRSGMPSTHSARLQIQPVPPQHAEEADALERDSSKSWSFKWRLVVSVDVVRGRNPTVQRAIKLRLPQAPIESSVGAKPRMSTPKKRTGGSP